MPRHTPDMSRYPYRPPSMDRTAQRRRRWPFWVGGLIAVALVVGALQALRDARATSLRAQAAHGVIMVGEQPLASPPPVSGVLHVACQIYVRAMHLVTNQGALTIRAQGPTDAGAQPPVVLATAFIGTPGANGGYSVVLGPYTLSPGYYAASIAGADTSATVGAVDFWVDACPVAPSPSIAAAPSPSIAAPVAAPLTPMAKNLQTGPPVAPPGVPLLRHHE